MEASWKIIPNAAAEPYLETGLSKQVAAMFVKNTPSNPPPSHHNSMFSIGRLITIKTQIFLKEFLRKNDLQKKIFLRR